MSPAANPAAAGQALSRTSVNDWETRHLVDTGEWLRVQARQSREVFDQIHQNVRGTDWSGDAKDAAVDRAGGDVSVVDRQATAMEEAASIADDGARDIQAAKRDALEAIQEAEDDGFRVAEDLSVSDIRRVDLLEFGNRRMAMMAHVETIQWRAEQLVQTDALVGRRLTEKAADLDGIRFEGDGDRATVQALGWGPWKQNPEIPSPPPPEPNQGSDLPRGLPPRGMLPPGEGPFTVGDPSRARPRRQGGKSLYDPEGGEWRYDPGTDKYHNPHWDYHPPGKNAKWENVPINNIPPHTPEAKPKAPKANSQGPEVKVPVEPRPVPKAPIEVPSPTVPRVGGGPGEFGPDLVPFPHDRHGLPVLGGDLPGIDDDDD